MSVSFHATRAGEHKGFVHVRTNIDTLVVPVEVQVIKGGVHRWPELLDFKTLTSSKEKQERQITVLNATPKPLAVTGVIHTYTHNTLSLSLSLSLTHTHTHTHTCVCVCVCVRRGRRRRRGKTALAGSCRSLVCLSPQPKPST
jgi:hypothetical protein